MAYLYDELMQEAPYEEWLRFTEEIFNQSGKNIHSVLDLGCGTGKITAMLASNEYEMIGVDMSSDMLTYAQQNADEKQLSIQWINQDIRELNGFSHQDAAISYCDVINYVTSKNELLTVFKRVEKSLVRDGLFIFDVHSLDYVNQFLINQTFAEVYDESSYIWFCIDGEQEGEIYHDLTFFLQEGEKYRRFQELHHQRTFSTSIYKSLLKEAGFKHVDFYTDFLIESKNKQLPSKRTFFVARKNSG